MRGTHGWCRRRPPTTLLRAALRYASHGWPVVPGTFAGATEGSHACRRVACLVRGAHPAVPDWPTACTVEPGRMTGFVGANGAGSPSGGRGTGT